MTKEERRIYNRNWMRNFRAKQREERYVSMGHCPMCSILLLPEYEKFHKGCPWYEEKIHAKIDLSNDKR